jgi:hypothetical protein
VTDPSDPTAGLPLTPTHGHTLVVCPWMTGAREADCVGTVVYISPAMWDLLAHAAGPDELQFLLDNILVVDLVRCAAVTFVIPPGAPPQ